MVLLPFMAWGNLKLFLRQCKLAEANNPQVRCWEALCPSSGQSWTNCLSCGHNYNNSNKPKETCVKWMFIFSL